jgi:hypothetical protein
VNRTPVYDIHTHLYEPVFGRLLLWGIDELLVYHYLVAEAFRHINLSYQEFWALPMARQAEIVWHTLFLEHSPISEACRGVVTTLNRLGLDMKKRDLPALRKWFSNWKTEDYVTRCLELAGIDRVCMTNSPFDDQERAVWQKGFARDDRFTSGLRLDPLLLNWPEAVSRLRGWGYRVKRDFSGKTMSEVRRFLDDWTGITRAQYLMVSLPPDFEYPSKKPGTNLLAKAVLPHCQDNGLPFAVMMGVERAVNPSLRLAGDGVGPSRMSALKNLCSDFSHNRFLATTLSRETQHSLCVTARKFRNLHIFGCWWFTNVPSLIDEITRLRLELVGLSMTPQHSDARVLDQLIYKWDHFRPILAKALTDKYTDLMEHGWSVRPQEIERDVQDLLGGAFVRFCRG